MSVGTVHRYKELSDDRFIGDLVGLFERRKIPVGDARVCEHFEPLLATSDAFRSQLFTLCSAISRMSAADLSGQQLLDLVARALGVTKGAADLPESLRAEFLAGYDAWTHRDLIGGDEWPPARKPPAREEAVYEPPADVQRSRPAAAPARPAGLPTVQEALELARIRGPIEMPSSGQGRKPAVDPLHEAAVSPASPPASAEQAPVPDAPVIPRLDTSALTIHELNALLKEIEERMARLSPHLLRSAQAADPTATVVPIRQERVPATTPEPSAFDLTPYLTPESSLTPRGITVDPAPVPANPPSPFPLRADSFGYRGEDQPVARHSYFESKTPVEAQLEGLGELLVPAVVPEPRPELVLSEPVLQFARPAGPPPVPPETLRLKMYVLIAALAGVVLIAAPLTGMMVYRQLHPMYIYHLPEPAPAAAPAPAAETAPSPAAPVAKPRSKSGSAAHKRQQAKRQPPRVAVWPPQPHY